MAEFVVMGGPAFLVAFALGLFIRRRFLALLGLLMLGAVLVWAAFDELDPPPHDGDLRPVIAGLWFTGWLLGLGVAGLTRGVGWLFGLGARDE